jgi:hypothetical protein
LNRKRLEVLVLFDLESRKIIAREHIDELQLDFDARREPLRVALGRRLVRLGGRVANVPLVVEEPSRLTFAPSRLSSNGFH